ncbi:hypothetical protein BGZ58_008888 [Dissophora ornata]|nr:hypothetical protein BGZ58_008888 [Dissophora ornata]
MQSNKAAVSLAVRARRGNTSEEATEAEKPKRASWDEAADQKIKEMVLEGRSWPTIGDELNRPYASCYSRYYSALDPALQEPWTLEIVERVEEWVRQGVCWKKIAKDLDMRPVSCKSKWMALKRLDIAPVTTATTTIAITTELNTELTTPLEKTSTAKDGRIKWIAFSKEESSSILELVGKHGSESWDLIHRDFQERFLHHGTSLSGKRLCPNRRRRTQRRILNITPLDLSHQFSRLARTKFHWTFDQETILVQQVLKYGAEGDHWENIAMQLTGIHTPEECRSHWKQLDMPICPSPVKWTKVEQSTFWDLWQELGSDFDRLSRLSGGLRSPADCKQYFETTTSDFSDPVEEPELFEKQVEDFRATLPMSRQNYVFTKERSLRLQRAMKYYGKQIDRSWAELATWSWVANRVQRGLSAAACMDHWTYLRKNMDVLYGPVEKGKSVVKPTVPNFWSHEELKLLDQGVRALGVSWNDIQEQFLPWRAARSIRQRWLLMSDKSTKVAEDEYYTIIAAGDNTGEIDYDALTQKMPGWNRSPCRRIFETSYKHLVATTVWLPEEDRLLVEKVLELKGRDWSAIARHFEGVQTARASLYNEAMAQLKPEGEDGSTPMRTQKTAWQCRLRWCQLVEPLMPKKWSWSVGGGSRALRLSKQLLTDPPTSKDTTTL